MERPNSTGLAKPSLEHAPSLTSRPQVPQAVGELGAGEAQLPTRGLAIEGTSSGGP